MQGLPFSAEGEWRVPAQPISCGPLDRISQNTRLEGYTESPFPYLDQLLLRPCCTMFCACNGLYSDT